MTRRRLRAAWRVLRGRPFDIAVSWGEPFPRSTDPSTIRIPALTVPNDREDLILSIGSGDWLWDGRPFPWATIGEFVLRFGEDDVTTVTVQIPVRMGGASVPDPERSLGLSVAS